MSVEFLEVEQIEVDLLPVEQITTITFKALWWALKTPQKRLGAVAPKARFRGLFRLRLPAEDVNET